MTSLEGHYEDEDRERIEIQRNADAGSETKERKIRRGKEGINSLLDARTKTATFRE